MKTLLEPYTAMEVEQFYRITLAIFEHACQAGTCPKDIKATWSNKLGFLRRIPGQAFYRPAANGIADIPTQTEQTAFVTALKIDYRRIHDANVKAELKGYSWSK